MTEYTRTDNVEYHEGLRAFGRSKQGVSRMTTDTTISKTDATELAHTFSWYMRDVAAGDNNGIYIYGGWLLSMQDRMGVELMKPEYIRNSIERAKEIISAEFAD